MAPNHSDEQSRHSTTVRFVQRLLDRALRHLGLGVRSLDELRALDLALEYHYYWNNAQQKSDIRAHPGFGPLAKQAITRERRYLTYDRLYTLWQAVGSLGHDSLVVTEVRAQRGGSTRFIAAALRWHGRQNRMHVFDTSDGPLVGGIAHYAQARANIRVVKGDFRETAAILDNAGPVGLAHVDVADSQITRFSLEYLADRMATGGFIIVDQYGFRKSKDIRRTVNEFVGTRTDFRRLHLLSGQAVLLRIDAVAPSPPASSSPRGAE